MKQTVVIRFFIRFLVLHWSFGKEMRQMVVIRFFIRLLVLGPHSQIKKKEDERNES